MESKEWERMEDAALAAAAQRGDEAAAEELVRRYKGIVVSKASFYFMAGGDREDVVQEGLIGIVKAIRSFDPDGGSSFATFADLCVNRQIISAVKGAARQKHRPLNESISFEQEVETEEGGSALLGNLLATDSESDPLSQLLLRECMDGLRGGGRESFSALERRVWQLYLQGRSYEEIAALLDRPLKSVDNAMQRARRKLRAML
jgi:RNA polymerase sporulation-specific sigma factor